MTPERLQEITVLIYGGGLTAMDAVELLNALNALTKREEKLQGIIDAALKTANGRWCEWGGRAESVRDILEGRLNAQ